MPETGIVILAAGNSSRLGRPKQLLEFHGRTLIEHIVDEAILSGLQPIVVVAGAVDLIAALANRPVKIIDNPHWREGMASSIVAGVTSILNAPIKALIITSCDQPHISAKLFQDMIAAQEGRAKGIVACSYAGITGIPVLFGRRYFTMLRELSGQEGAKKILRKHAADVEAILFPEGEIDIDTDEDYKRLSGA